jgi:hypothetical protein
MKTTFLTIFTALVLATGIATTTYAAPAKNETYTILNNVSVINKIEVRGNVELYISDGAADEVKVYNKYYAENALVQTQNGVLSIASYKAEKLVVWVAAADLRSISAFDNAEVKSFGDISKIEFNVDLHNNASANLKFNTYSANITVNDQAKASLSGSADEYSLKYSHAENVSEKSFETSHSSKTLNPSAEVKIKKSELEELAAILVN